MEDMIEDIRQENLRSARVYDSLKDDSKKRLYITVVRVSLVCQRR